jgi:hypothetical protein
MLTSQPTSKVVVDTEEEFFTFKEGEVWICAWKRWDIVTQGQTEQIATGRMLRAIASYAIDMSRDGTMKAFGTLKHPTLALLTQWRRAHEATHGR